MLRGFVALSLACALSSAITLLLSAEEKLPPKSISELAGQLDSARYRERHQAQQALLKRSLIELAPLRELAKKSRSSEVRAQLQSLFDTVEHRELAKAFEKLAAGKSDAELDLEESLWLITLLSDPNPSREEMNKELDSLAALVRQRLPADPPPAKQDPRKVMDTLHAALYGEKKFRINFVDYNNLANASALEVLRKQQGLPITLGLVTVCVGRRLSLPIDGVATPGRFLIKYRAKPKEPFSPDDLFLDPIGEGKVSTVEEVVADFTDGNQFPFDTARQLGTASRRATVQRMLSNVVNALSRLGEERRMGRVQQYMQIVGEDDAEKLAPE